MNTTTNGIAIVIAGLFELPDKIAIASTDHAEKRAAYDGLLQTRAVARADTLVNATTLTVFDDGKGSKRAAKNDDEREAAITMLWSHNDTNNALDADIDRARAELDRASAEYERLKALQTNYRELAKLLVTEPY